MNEDEYEYSDWLKNVEKVGGAFCWVLQRRNFPQCGITNAPPTARTPTELLEHVLRSERVQDAIQRYAKENGKTIKETRLICRNIGETLGHNINITKVRCVGYLITKVLSTIFDEVMVNMKQLRKMREVFKETPIVFIPTHRTYVDFLLLSILCFDQEVTLPAIAAAMDFMNSKIIGEMLRSCGAFFIRRAVGEDILYWSIFAEYVQEHIVQGDRPVEFFIEGTRSRVGKSLQPKYGLLQILLEPYLRGKVYDVVIVPVAMSYDKILEEQLYGYELLGFPKPKESASGLLKARTILDKKFGRASVHFCPPISVRSYLGLSVKRSTFVCQPDSQWKLEERERRAIREFGHQIVKDHHDHLKTSVWPFFCMAVLQSVGERGTTTQEVMERYRKLIGLTKAFGLPVDIRRSEREDLESLLHLHRDLFADVDLSEPDAVLTLVNLPVEKPNGGGISQDLLSQAVVPIILNNYANECMHMLATPAIISLCVLIHQGNCMQDAVRTAYKKTRTLMYREFVVDLSTEDFDDVFNRMCSAQLIHFEDGLIRIIDSSALNILSSAITPLMHVYGLMAEILLEAHPIQITQSEGLTRSQSKIADLIASNSLPAQSISTEPLKNAFGVFETAGCIKKQGSNFLIHEAKLRSLNDEIQSTLQRLGQGRAKL